MAGVEILATQEVATAFGFDLMVFQVTVGICAIVATAIVGCALFNDIGAYSFLFGWIGGLILGMILGCVLASNAAPSEYETQYKVTISDEVKMNDFLEKYEIVDQDGKIYVVRERD